MSLKQLDQKIVDGNLLVELREQFEKDKKQSVFTNGCFDLIHLGHIDYLLQAKQLGDVLIVGVNSDHSVRGLEKGLARPIKDERQRATILAALQFVDFVVIFDDPTPIELIKSLVPNVLVKGGDYSPHQKDDTQKNYIVGSKETLGSGNRVEVIPFLEGYSTSKLEQKIIDSVK